ncbi:hypothetical protein [Segetibacter koreensis]|uniref:hypothetical protein n=1 Tax=Segetibacter koreensis TaxID=398037 RepID=UPI00035DA445|nr:hypothetical protein [Segetibacter koreensis]
MKKLLLSALLAATVAVSAFAGTEKVSSVAISNFNASFKRASDVSWTVDKDYVKATFILNNVRTEALYTPNGEFIGTNTAVSLDELPVRAKRTFAKKYNGYTVKEAIRFEGNDEGAYFISAANEKESVILKVSDNSQVSVMKATKN